MTESTGNPVLDRPCELLNKAGTAWDKAFRQLNDDPTPANMRVFQAAQQAYTQAQRTYLLAVTVSQLLPPPAAVPSVQPLPRTGTAGLTQEYTDANTNR